LSQIEKDKRFLNECKERKFPTTSVDFDDYKYWIRLPVPLNAVPKELLTRIDAKDIGDEHRKKDYENLLYNHWVERISDFRCRLFFECMSQLDRGKKKDMIRRTFDVASYGHRNIEKPKAASN
jgi:hypothetical protein